MFNDIGWIMPTSTTALALAWWVHMQQNSDSRLSPLHDMMSLIVILATWLGYFTTKYFLN